jgi:guanosine-3',5'-bis(diphosphate) 3'-pyrophosphohydrolase
MSGEARKPEPAGDPIQTSFQRAALGRRLPTSPFVWRAVGYVEYAYGNVGDPRGAEHCFEVAGILGPRRSEVVLATALLHDVLEDTETEPGLVRRSFGRSVSDLVELLTEDPTLEGYGPRKRALRSVVRSAPSDAQLVFTADKLAKVRAIVRAEKAPAKRRWRHYLESHAMLADTGVDRRLVNRLGRELAAAAESLGLPAPAA